MNILFIGDVFGEVGRDLIDEYLQNIKKEYSIDFVIANGFNKGTSYVGLFIALFNLSAGLLSFVVQPRLFKSKQKNTSFLPALSIISVVVSLIAFLSINGFTGYLWLSLMLATILNTTFIALVQDTITKIDINNEKGALIGINQAIQSLGVFLGTISAGIVLSKFMFGPILLGAIMFLITFLVNKFIVAKRLNV